jgi:hypothetical protein
MRACRVRSPQAASAEREPPSALQQAYAVASDDAMRSRRGQHPTALADVVFESGAWWGGSVASSPGATGRPRASGSSHRLRADVRIETRFPRLVARLEEHFQETEWIARAGVRRRALARDRGLRPCAIRSCTLVLKTPYTAVSGSRVSSATTSCRPELRVFHSAPRINLCPSSSGPASTGTVSFWRAMAWAGAPRAAGRSGQNQSYVFFNGGIARWPPLTVRTLPRKRRRVSWDRWQVSKGIARSGPYPARYPS